jgi:hypothetical protein
MRLIEETGVRKGKKIKEFEFVKKQTNHLPGQDCNSLLQKEMIHPPTWNLCLLCVGARYFEKLPYATYTMTLKLKPSSLSPR